MKENYDTCNKDYVCQTIDPICGPCFEYTDGSVSLSVCSCVRLFDCSSDCSKVTNILFADKILL